MNSIAKWLLVSAVAASLVVTGVYVDRQLDLTAKEKRFQDLRELEQRERAVFESMTVTSEEETLQREKQGLKVKQIGLEVRKLREELYPISPRDQLMHDIAGQKSHFKEKHNHYKFMSNDPERGAVYQKAYDILQQKAQTLAQIERDFNEGNKPLEQLRQEFDQLMKIPELQ